jgi:hypothetical protein
LQTQYRQNTTILHQTQLLKQKQQQYKKTTVQKKHDSSDKTQQYRQNTTVQTKHNRINKPQHYRQNTTIIQTKHNNWTEKNTAIVHKNPEKPNHSTKTQQLYKQRTTAQIKHNIITRTQQYR